MGFDDDQPVGQAIINMEGRSVFKLAIEKVVPSIDLVLEKLELSTQSVKFLVLHQANQRIIKQIQLKCGFEDNQVVSVVSQYGNVSAASIPIALADIQNQLEEGDVVVFAGFGAGFTWGVNVIRWTKSGGINES